jgi:hypothetical protein
VFYSNLNMKINHINSSEAIVSSDRLSLQTQRGQLLTFLNAREALELISLAVKRVPLFNRPRFYSACSTNNKGFLDILLSVRRRVQIYFVHHSLVHSQILKKNFLCQQQCLGCRSTLLDPKLTANVFDLTACNVVTADSAGCLQMTRLCYKSGISSTAACTFI